MQDLDGYCQFLCGLVIFLPSRFTRMVSVNSGKVENASSESLSPSRACYKLM